MSVGHMPKPPERPTNQAPPEDVQTQPTPGTDGNQSATGGAAVPATPGASAGSVAQGAGAAQPAASQPEQAPATEPLAPPLPLNEDMAKVLESQAEVIVQRQMYHSQMMVGVSALGTDAVSARNAVLTVANALRNKNTANLEYALVKLGDPQLEQINDHTLPWKFNAQVAGLMEGLLIDTLMQAYRDDSTKQREARNTLESLFLEANERAEQQHKAQLAFLSPGPGPNARK